MKRAILVAVVMAAVGCGGSGEEPRNTGPTFGTVCFSDACTTPDGDGFLTVYAYNGEEVASCSWGPGRSAACRLTSDAQIQPEDLAACHGDGPRAPCP